MFTVKRLADLLGVSTDLVRHYTENSVLDPVVNSENNYKYYDEVDFLLLANARNSRTLGFSLAEVKKTQTSAVSEKSEQLQKRLQTIQLQIEDLERVRKRLKEEAFFLDLTKLCNGTVKDVRRLGIHSVYAFSAKGSKKLEPDFLKKWTSLFPFSHVSIKIPKEELNDPNFSGPYSVELGFGLVEDYVREFGIETDPPVENIPEGRFLIIYLRTRDLLSLTPKELAPLLEKAAQLGKKFTHQSSGRLLAIEKDEKGLIFSILIRVRIGD